MIQNERKPLADSLWSATANQTQTRLALPRDAEADVVIVGGGLTGRCAALHIAEAGQSVILLEAETPGWGASRRPFGADNCARHLGSGGHKASV